MTHCLYLLPFPGSYKNNKFAVVTCSKVRRPCKCTSPTQRVFKLNVKSSKRHREYLRVQLYWNHDDFKIILIKQLSQLKNNRSWGFLQYFKKIYWINLNLYLLSSFQFYCSDITQEQNIDYRTMEAITSCVEVNMGDPFIQIWLHGFLWSSLVALNGSGSKSAIRLAVITLLLNSIHNNKVLYCHRGVQFTSLSLGNWICKVEVIWKMITRFCCDFCFILLKTVSGFIKRKNI